MQDSDLFTEMILKIIFGVILVTLLFSVLMVQTSVSIVAREMVANLFVH